MWFVYIIEASDGSLYTGITTNVERRFQQHLTGKGGAKYFNNARKPTAVKYTEEQPNRSEASKREAVLKKLSHTQKLQLIQWR